MKSVPVIARRILVASETLGPEVVPEIFPGGFGDGRAGVLFQEKVVEKETRRRGDFLAFLDRLIGQIQVEPVFRRIEETVHEVFVNRNRFVHTALL